MDAPEGKTPFRGRCGDCDHEWVVAWLPMPVRDVAALAKAARCPLCGSAQVYVASGTGGETGEASP